MKNVERTYPPLSRTRKIELYISYTLKSLVLLTIIFSIITFDLFLIASAMIIFLFSMLPAIIERKLRITLPIEVDLVITTFIFMHFMLGEAAQFYDRFVWFDKMLHMSSGIMIGLVGFSIMYFFLYTQKIEANPLLIAVFSVSFSLAAGAIWEMFEFFMDMVFGFNMQKSGLTDTMTDLIVDFVGACLVGIGAYRYLKKDEDGFIKSMVKHIIHYNIRLQTKRQQKKKKSIQSEST